MTGSAAAAAPRSHEFPETETAAAVCGSDWLGPRGYVVPIAIRFPSEPIVGQLDLIPQLAADEEIHDERQSPHQPHG